MARPPALGAWPRDDAGLRANAAADRFRWTRRGVAVCAYDLEPTDLRYSTYLPVAYLVERGLDVHLVCRGGRRARRSMDGATIWVEPSAAAATVRAARLRPELLFVESSSYGLLWTPFARRRWVRNPVWSTQAVLRGLQRRAIRRYDAVAFTNPYHALAWPVRAEQRADLPYPVDLAFWSAPVERDEAIWEHLGRSAPPGPVITYVANLMARKRQVELVEAIAPLLGERPDVLVVLAGWAFEPAVEATVRSRAAALGVGDRIVVTGRLEHDRIRSLLAWSSATVINTASETQCMALYEALAAGVPATINDIPELTSAFSAVPRHRTAAELRTNVAALLDDPTAGAAQRAAAEPVLATADLATHDAAFHATVDRLLRRPRPA